MSYKRNQEDNKKNKNRNFVAKNDFNKGGFHGKSKKAMRTNFKQALEQYDYDDLINENF